MMLGNYLLGFDSLHFVVLAIPPFWKKYTFFLLGEGFSACLLFLCGVFTVFSVKTYTYIYIFTYPPYSPP